MVRAEDKQDKHGVVAPRLTAKQRDRDCDVIQDL